MLILCLLCLDFWARPGADGTVPSQPSPPAPCRGLAVTRERRPQGWGGLAHRR